MNKKPSWAVIRRLPRYFRHLRELEALGEKKISSGNLAARMGLTASQVRQDFNCFGGFGQQGYGYNVGDLKRSIAEILGIDKPRRAIIAGAGNLGRALIRNFSFPRYQVELVAAFDVDPCLIGQEISGVPVLALTELERYLSENAIDVGLLTLPREFVLPVAMRMVAGGVRGLWNFTSMDLHLDLPNIPVENVHFSESLMVLSYQLENNEGITREF